MPRPSRSILMMPRSAQSSLSHCTTRRPGIDAGSIGTTSSRRPAAITMPPECWPRWRGSPRTRSTRSSSREHARRFGVDAALAQQRLRLVEILAQLERGQHLREPVDHVGAESEHLAHLAHRHARAIGDHVGGHRRAVPSVPARRRTGSPLRAARPRAGRCRCRAIRRAPPTGSARRAAPCRRDRPR